MKGTIDPVAAPANTKSPLSIPVEVFKGSNSFCFAIANDLVATSKRPLYSLKSVYPFNSPDLKASSNAYLCSSFKSLGFTLRSFMACCNSFISAMSLPYWNCF